MDSGAQPSMRRPSKWISPFFGWSLRSPAMVRRSVVFPAPLGPSTVKISPSAISREAPNSA
jgi:hypothetical protein